MLFDLVDLEMLVDLVDLEMLVDLVDLDMLINIVDLDMVIDLDVCCDAFALCFCKKNCRYLTRVPRFWRMWHSICPLFSKGHADFFFNSNN